MADGILLLPLLIGGLVIATFFGLLAGILHALFVIVRGIGRVLRRIFNFGSSASDQADVRICPSIRCAHRNRAEAQFCSQCGTRL